MTCDLELQQLYCDDRHVTTSFPPIINNHGSTAGDNGLRFVCCT